MASLFSPSVKLLAEEFMYEDYTSARDFLIRLAVAQVTLDMLDDIFHVNNVKRFRATRIVD
jgi:hypothetical protein